MSYNYLFDIALILLSTKGLGLVTKKFSMPQVVGALLAGLVLGPAMLNVLHETDFIKQIAELGVIVLMFTAGLETDLQELKKTGKASFVIAVFGVLVPLLFGFITASFFNQTSTAEGVSHTLQNIFIGIILTATSVSITVETLKELGKLNTRAGNAILGAAIIDDILGIVALTLITSCADSSVNIVLVLGKVILFFVFAILAGMLFYKFFIYWVQRYNRDMRRFVVISFVFCLILAFLAEEWFGVADITGAFIAGLILSNTSCVHYITSRFETISYMLLSPIFFASIGIQVDLSGMNQTLLLFTIVLVVIAIISKIIGCGLGAKLCHYSTKESLQVGVGMVSRGEVALIVASKGAALGLMSAVNFGPIVVVVVITTIVTPILLKIVFSSKKDSRNLTKTNSKLIKS
ncbi:cation:proton antiporter [Turicibacter sanguinis]|nr:cation:proton antiporter [Turicibacter sanguinis]MTH09897.1 cation:proton antiporter [Turicibacter sanguinis]MTH13277.1 cation:proton antiporter [Turicibacter sanguinis]MTH20259.1 cation:proton antiporter [Turicibacter sanguinis]MTH41207.1 cation:proton antiporter [Turicibacter sanguinis]